MIEFGRKSAFIDNIKMSRIVNRIPKQAIFSFLNKLSLCLAFASLESLGQDKTFKSLESLVRLFQKVLKLIIL